MGLDKVDPHKAQEKFADHADHSHEVDSQMVRGDLAHEMGVPLDADHFHLDTLTGQLVSHDEFHGKGPVAWLTHVISKFLAKTDLFREARPGQRPEGSQAQRSGTLSSSRVQRIDPVKIREALLRAKESGQEKATAFEWVFLGRFVERKPLGEELPQGKFRFLQKPDGEWKNFFQKFLPFTLEKKARVADLEGVVYRGFFKTPVEMTVREGMAKRAAETAMLISDLKFTTGKTEKFARIPLTLQASQLTGITSLAPGEILGKAVLQQWFASPDVVYLALSHKIVRPDLAKAMANALTESAAARAGGGIAYAREPQQGIALAARTEELIAKQLDIGLRPVIQPTTPEARGRDLEGRMGSRGVLEREGGLFAWLRRRKGEEEEAVLAPGFVPWYQLIFRAKKWKGKPKWYVPLIYFVVASSIGLFLVYLFKFLLRR